MPPQDSCLNSGGKKWHKIFHQVCQSGRVVGTQHYRWVGMEITLLLLHQLEMKNHSTRRIRVKFWHLRMQHKWVSDVHGSNLSFHMTLIRLRSASHKARCRFNWFKETGYKYIFLLIWLVSYLPLITSII